MNWILIEFKCWFICRKLEKAALETCFIKSRTSGVGKWWESGGQNISLTMFSIYFIFYFNFKFFDKFSIYFIFLGSIKELIFKIYFKFNFVHSSYFRCYTLFIYNINMLIFLSFAWFYEHFAYLTSLYKEAFPVFNVNSIFCFSLISFSFS